MPPTVVKTVRDLIFWQYAKIIAASAGIGKRDYGFVMNRFKQLRQGEIFWNEIREYVKEKEQGDECIFCGARTDLTLEHLLPRAFNGPDVEKNLVWVCKRCNSSKGARRLYEHFAIQAGVEAAKYGVPRIAEGKYLKFAFETLKEKGFLEMGEAELNSAVCPTCDMKGLCIRQGTEGKLSPFCIDGMLTLSFR
ncbi:MAG: HNH endonuclease [Candidatus Bathyarchaeia archaeon]